MTASERAQAVREYRHYRAMLECKRLNTEEKRRIADRANALASRFNLTTARVTA